MPQPEQAVPVRLLQVTAFVSTLDRFAMPPLLVAIAADLGASLAEVVQAAGVYFLAYGLSQPLWGAVSDRVGRVRTMRSTLLLAAVATTISAGSGSVLVLGIARGVAGGLYGAAYPSLLIYLGDTVPVARRQREVARLMVGVAMGTAVASLGAGLLAELTTWRVAFVLTGLASLVVVWRLRALPEPPGRGRPGSPLVSLGLVARSPTTLLVLAVAFTEGAVLLGALTLLPPALESGGATAAVAGAATAVYGASVFLSARLVGRLSATWHPARLIVLGGLAAVLGCAALALSQSAPMGVGVSALLGLAWTAMHSSLQTWATEVLPQARASVVSLFAGSLFVGSALAALAVAGLADEGRYDVVFLLGAALAVPLTATAALARTRWQRPTGPADS